MKSKYHCLLFVPAEEKLLSKIEGCKADAVIIDLEDAILPSKKDAALTRLNSFLKGYSYSIDLFVRINPGMAETEISTLNGYNIQGYMLPKSESADDVNAFATLADGKKIIALIESAAGVINAGDIAKCANTDIIAFGAEDYTTECGIENENEYLVYPKSKIVACAKAYGKPVIDTVSLNIRDREKYIIDAKKSKSFGFDGKLAIHPMQVEVINDIYNEDIVHFKKIVSEYDMLGKSVAEINGKIYEKPHIDAMRRKIKENSRRGS